MFGEDVVGCARDQGIFYWDGDSDYSAGDRAVSLDSLPGATDVPTIATRCIASEKDRHIIAFGADPLTNPGVQDPMLIRWCDQENAADWRPTTTNTAGDILLSSGSKIITAISTRQEIMVWTDTSLYAMRYIGGLYIFSVAPMAKNVSIAGYNSAVSFSDQVYWMGKDASFRLIKLPQDQTPQRMRFSGFIRHLEAQKTIGMWSSTIRTTSGTMELWPEPPG